MYSVNGTNSIVEAMLKLTLDGWNGLSVRSLHEKQIYIALTIVAERLLDRKPRICPTAIERYKIINITFYLYSFDCYCHL